MKLYMVYFTYKEHEMENELYAGSEGTTSEGREYLLSVYIDSSDNGYMEDARLDPSLLVIDAVSPFNTVVDKRGNPYKVGLL